MSEHRYNKALEAVRRVIQRDDERAAEDCRTVLLTHGHPTPRATVFFHGMTASPRQFERLAHYAHALGDNVFVPRLPKHGYRDRLTDALADMQRGVLQTNAEQSLEIARGLGTQVRVVGFSLGGMIAAWIAQNHSVEQAIAVAPLLGIAGIPSAVTPALVRALSRLPNMFFWWNPIQREKLMPAHGYPRFATHAVAESLAMALELSATARTRAPRSPIVLVTNSGEMTVNNRAVSRLAKDWLRNAGASVHQRRIRGLGLSHDIIEPLRPGAKVEKTYPILHELLSH